MKIKYLKKGVSATKRIPQGMHIQIDYDLMNDELIVSEILTTNSYIVYDGRKVCHVCDVSRPMTITELREEVEKAVMLRG